MYYHMKRLCIT